MPGPDPDRRRDRAELAVIALVVSVVGGLVRWWARAGATPRIWKDTAQYLDVSRSPWLSAERWAGIRAPLVPSVLTLVSQRLTTFVTLQSVVAAVAWAVLALAVASLVPAGWRRWAGGAAVLGASLVGPVVMWDQQVLTESWSISLMVLTAAALTWAACGLDRRRVAALVASVVLLLAVRDSNVIPVLVGGGGLALWAVIKRPPSWILAVGTAVVLVALSLLVVKASGRGEREVQPTEHLYEARVLPYPDRVAWFSDHGMPDAELVTKYPSAGSPEQAPWVDLPHVRALYRWRAWVHYHGRSTYGRYVLTHPAFVVTEPLQNPERVFDNGRGLAHYRPSPLRDVPVVTGVFWPAVGLTTAIAFVALAAAVRRRLHLSPLVVAGVVLVVTAAPHALVVWHSDGMESARHLLIPGLQLRLGTLLLVLGALLVARTTTTDGTEAPVDPA